MSAATHALEAESSFPARKKARTARNGHRGHVSKSAHALEAGSSFPAQKKRVGECHSPTLFSKIKYLFV
ncbi:MAG: hypothetical protein FWF77_03465 [Defluviitaleaceae bacterium]|nr:hypothetical protein [Defluviitaleaceae bacterium]